MKAKKQYCIFNRSGRDGFMTVSAKSEGYKMELKPFEPGRSIRKLC